MDSPFQTFKAGKARAISKWMAVLARFISCTLPALATPGSGQHPRLLCITDVLGTILGCIGRRLIWSNYAYADVSG